MFAITNSNGNPVTIDYATNAYGNKVFVIDGFIEVIAGMCERIANIDSHAKNVTFNPRKSFEFSSTRRRKRCSLKT